MYAVLTHPKKANRHSDCGRGSLAHLSQGVKYRPIEIRSQPHQTTITIKTPDGEVIEGLNLDRFDLFHNGGQPFDATTYMDALRRGDVFYIGNVRFARN